MAGRKIRYDTGYYDIIRFFGEAALDPSAVAVRYESHHFELKDARLVEFASEIEQRMRREGRLKDGPAVMKLSASNLRALSPSITVRPVAYGLQAATCFALDFPHPLFEAHGGTLRDYYLAGRKTGNPLAVCLGVCGYLLLDNGREQCLLQVERAGNLASLENTYGPSVAGVVDYVEGYSNLRELTVKSLAVEIGEELNLKSGEYEIVPLAWATEIFRGERPQVFCLVRSSLSRDEVAERLEAVAPSEQEYHSYEFLDLDNGSLVVDSVLDKLNFEAKANYLLLEEYLGGPGDSI